MAEKSVVGMHSRWTKFSTKEKEKDAMLKESSQGSQGF